MEGEEILINPATPTAAVVYSYPGGGGSRTTLEAHDDGAVLLVLGAGASSASTDAPATYPDLTSPTTRSNLSYTDWTTAPVVDEADMERLLADAAVSQDDQVAGAVAEPVRGGLGGLGVAATSLAMSGLIAGGVDTPVTAIALYGVLIAGVVLVTVHVFRA